MRQIMDSKVDYMTVDYMLITVDPVGVFFFRKSAQCTFLRANNCYFVIGHAIAR